jgi:hypothetical protein
MDAPRFDGTCPSCGAAGAVSPMRLNSECLHECPNCHLQVQELHGAVVIWHALGRGDFSPPSWAYPLSEGLHVIMYEHNENWPRGAGPLIGTPEHLMTYLAAVRRGTLPSAR